MIINFIFNAPNKKAISFLAKKYCLCECVVTNKFAHGVTKFARDEM